MDKYIFKDMCIHTRVFRRREIYSGGERETEGGREGERGREEARERESKRKGDINNKISSRQSSQTNPGKQTSVINLQA